LWWNWTCVFVLWRWRFCTDVVKQECFCSASARATRPLCPSPPCDCRRVLSIALKLLTRILVNNLSKKESNNEQNCMKYWCNYLWSKKAKLRIIIRFFCWSPICILVKEHHLKLVNCNNTHITFLWPNWIKTTGLALICLTYVYCYFYK